jgi:large repetitive protein
MRLTTRLLAANSIAVMAVNALGLVFALRFLCAKLAKLRIFVRLYSRLALAVFAALMSFYVNSPSIADPAANPASIVQAGAGAISSTVPDGTCSANVTLKGGSGASSSAAGTVVAVGGGGATISAKFKVLPLQLVAGTVAAGGIVPAVGAAGGGGSGAAAGGNGGVVAVSHRGGSGGGSTDFRVAGIVLMVAGGGGGSGAAHIDGGSGGSGGFTGIAAGVVAPGVSGLAGTNGVVGQTVGGGQGGQVAAGGIGGLMVPDGVPSFNGFAGGGVGIGTGGSGGNDNSNDSGGGGGGGYTGGGGGSSTTNNTVTGGGGGGGSSYVAATSPNVAATAPTAVTGTVGTATAAGSVPGAAGSATIDWVPCQYNLVVAKSASPSSVKAGAKTTWTVTVTNSGPDPMTRGDTVTLADTLPVGPNGAPTPAFKVLSVSNSGGSNTEMASGAISCAGVTVGSAMPASTVCSRPYSAASAPGAPAGGTRGLDGGESLTITYEQIISNKASCQTITNVASTVDRSTLSGTTDITGTNVAKSASTPLALQCYDLGVTKTVSPTVATNGQVLTWTVVVKNNGLADMQGPDDTASNPLIVTDAAPTANLSAPVSFTSTGPAGACTYAGNTITCPQSLAAGQSQAFTFSQTVSNGAKNGDVLPNSASVTDFNPGDTNDSATASATVAAKPTLQITKISNGGVGAFTFTGGNGWTSQAITTVTAGTGVTGAVQTLTAAGAITTLNEAMPAGYGLAGATCTGLGAGGTVASNPATGTVTLDAAATAAGSVIACTVTNNKLPTIAVRKISNGGVGTFNFTGDNGWGAQTVTTVTSGTGVTGTAKILTAASTITNIAETIPPGYTLSSISCAGTGAGNTTNNLAAGSVQIGTLGTPPGAVIVCTFTNTKLPTLTLVKTVANLHGGTLLVPAVTLTATGPTNISGATSAPAVTNSTVQIGTYALSESAVPGYVAGPWSCSAGTLTGDSLALAAGQNATCAINNTDISPVLTLAKTITNDSGGTSLASDFTLTAAGTTTITGATGSPAVTAANVDVGTYLLSETGPAGYTAGAWSCSGGTLTGNSLALALGQAATCTINNNDNGPTLTLTKTVTNDNGGTAAVSAFTLKATGPTIISGLTAAASVTNAAVDAGTYILSETGPTGYAAGSWSCSAGTLTGNSLVLGLGQNANCTINNNDISPKLTLVKTITNDSGGTNVVADFILKATGPTILSGVSGAAAVTNADVNIGNYVLTETGPAGYAQSSWSCSAGSLAGNILTLALNDNATCTVNNNDISPKLTLVKTVTNSNGGTATVGAFTLTATGPTIISGASASAAVTNAAVNAGTYILSESGPAGYAAGAWSCSAGTLTGNSLSLALNQSASCTINNTDIAPKLTLVKSIINDNGGTSIATDVTLSAAGPTPITGSTGAAAVTSATVKAGIYTLSETSLPGYSAGSWSCTAGTVSGSNVTLTPGQDATCSIVNNDISPKLTLTKTVTNSNGGIAVATDFILTATGPTPISGATGAVTITAAPVNAGTYTLSETGPTGYNAGAWSCSAGTLTGNSLVLALNQNATCSITNSDIAAHLTLVKTITNDNGGTSVATSFTLGATGASTISGATASAAVTNVAVPAGTYALSETGPAGYTAGAWSCTGGILSGSSLTLGSNQSATCTINNDDKPATLTLTKISNGAVGPFTFNGNNGVGVQNLTTLTSGTAVATSPITLTATSTPTMITETIPTGFGLSSATCTGMGANGTATPNLVTGALALNAAAVAPGSNVNCTFINAKASYTVAKSASAASVNAPGPVTYTITVVNTGLADMTSPAISDTLTLGGSPRTLTSGPTLVSGDNAPTGILNVGETWTFTATYNVTQVDIDAGGTLANTATFSTQQTAPVTSAPATTALPRTPKLTVDKQVDPTTPSFSAVGNTIKYKFVVLNSGNTTITSQISITDPKISPAAVCPLPGAGLAPNQSITCTGTSIPMVQADLDAGSFTNSATATDGTITSSPDSVTVPAVQTPKMAIAKSTAVAPVSSFTAVGDTWYYKYDVTNTGNVTMAAPINVTDNVVTPHTFLCSNTNLTPGATVSCAASYVVTLDDLSLGSITNIAFATSLNGISPQTSLTVPPLASPALTINKSSPTLNFNAAGATITYKYRVINSGGATFTSIRPIKIVDDKIGTFTCFTPSPTFGPGAFVDCPDQTYTVTQAQLDAGFLTNQAYAQTTYGGLAPVGNIVVSSPPKSVTVNANQNPVLTVTKSVSPALAGVLGQSLTYTIKVKNDGNVTASNIAITDLLIPSLSCTIASLAPTASDNTCTGTYIVKQSDIDAGHINNTASATGTAPLGNSVSGSGSLASPVPQTKTMAVAKAQSSNADEDGSGTITLNDTLTYNVTATNTGNVTQTNVVVTDTKITPNSKTCASVAPGTSCFLTGTYVVTQANVNAGTIGNTGSITSDIIITPLTAPISTPVAQTSTLSVDKVLFANLDQDTSSSITLGDTLTFKVTTTNTGTVTQNNVVVTDSKITPNSTTCASLAPAATCLLTGTYTVTQADVNAGTIGNTGSVTSNLITTPVTTTIATPVAQVKTMTVVKTQTTYLDNDTSGNITKGDKLSYTVTATNTGTVTQTNVVVTDSKITPNSQTCATVALGATCVLSGTYTIVQADADAGTIGNTGSLTSDIITTPQTSTVNTPVIRVVVATNDVVSGVNGATGNPSVDNAYANDTLNGAAVTPTSITGTVTSPATPVSPGAPVPALDPSTGNVSVPAGTPAGTYIIAYQICETANPTNCKTASISVTVDPSPITVANDSITGINGASGQPNVLNAFTGDTINGVAASPSNAILSVATPVPAGLTFDPASGDVSVDPATPAGVYTFDYKICEQLNPLNCKTATVSVTVDPAPMVATADTPPSINGATGGSTPSVLDNDTLNGNPVTIGVTGNSTLTPGTIVAPPAAGSITMNADGTVAVAAGTTAGTYSYPYTICEKLNPTNCKTTTTTIVVDKAPIAAGNDTPPSINGASGRSTPSVLGNDTLNGLPVTVGPTGNSTLTPGTAPSPTAGSITMNADGTVTVAAGTTAGTYVYSYTICEKLNPLNCSMATTIIVVDAAPVVATNDTVGGIDGATGAANVVNAFTGDTINGLAATAANSVLTSVTPVPTGLTFIASTGNVSVDPATPAGVYTFDYKICETLNPANCKIATVTVTVVPAPLVATDDTPSPINGATGGSTPSVLGNDTLNGAPVTLLNSTLTPGTAPTPAAGLITMNPDGTVTVAPGTTAGSYPYSYSICEILNPLNCKTATTTIVVDAAPVVATNDTIGGIDGATGAANVVNAFTGDTINGVPATPTNSVLSVSTPVPTGLTFNAGTGNVSVDAATPAGIYTFDYNICELLNPTNCKIATISVTVVAAPIVATDDTPPSINGASGGSTASVIANDTLNGLPVTVGPTGNVVLTPGTAPTPTAGAISMNADGTVTVAAGTTAGTYTYSYTICEKLNPTNCKTATTTIVVDAAPVVATNDTSTGINGLTGAANVLNAFTGDTINGLAATPTNAVLSVSTPVPTGLTFSTATGDVSVDPATPAGVYTFDYQICEKLNPANCKTATVSVTVVPAPLVATDDAPPAINGASGGSTLNVLANDTLNGLPVTVGPTGNSTLTPGTAPAPTAGSITMNADGTVTVAAGTTAGSHPYTYTICEKLNPTNCKTATTTVVVDAAPVVATNDTVDGINGLTGAPNVLNAFTGDTINGLAASPANSVLSVSTPVPTGLTFNASTGDVSVDPATPAGTYTFDYQICEKLNPANCKTATVSVTVVPAPIVATDDTPPTINGASGGSTPSVLGNDTLNGNPVTVGATGNSTLTPGTAPAPTAGSITMNADGTVTVAPGTTAGSYPYTYTICEILNPSNCKTATATIVVGLAPIVATNDSVSGINGATGAANVVNAFTGDTINGLPATIANSTLSVATPVPTGLAFNAGTGDVSVDPATPAGIYTFDYKICEKLNLTNCKIATVSVTVVPAPLVATDDAPPAINGASGGSTLSVLGNDTLNGAPVTLLNATLTPGTAPTPLAGSITMNLDGTVTVAPGTTAGNYSYPYTICEILNPLNCKTAVATIVVGQAPIVATIDTPPSINGATGGSTTSVLGNDTLNGNPATLSNVNLTPGTAPAPTAGSITMNPDGTVTVAAGTTAGTYDYSYTICEQLNPLNCVSTTTTIVVDAAPVVATNDTTTGINGLTGAANVVNAFSGDTINGLPATAANAVLSVSTPVPTGLSFSTATGDVSVDPATPAGVYTFDYQICEKLNPANCKTATVSVTVDPAPIAATNDTPPSINGASGGSTPTVIANDTLNGLPVSVGPTGNVTLTPGTAPTPTAGSITMNPDGTVTVAAGTTAGSYPYTYTICEKLNPLNCKTATATIVVDPAPVVATNDSVTGINGLTGATNVVNAFTGDTINGLPATTANSTLSISTPVPTGLTFNAGTGNVSVDPATPVGSYTFDYQICEKLNPANCKTATVSVTVAPAPIVATADTPPSINGASGGSTPTVLGNDTLNGLPVTVGPTGNVILTPGTAPTPTAGAITMNPDGTVTVAAGTTAGTYTYNYTICEKLNPTNCKTTTTTIVVDPAPIVATIDTPPAVSGVTGATIPTVLGNDTLNGNPVTLATINLTPGTAPTPTTGSITMNPDGTVTVAAGTTAGTYTYSYTICEKLNPSNCATNKTTIVVDAAPIVAMNDTVGGINGLTGAPSVVNAFAGDTINGVPATAANAILTPATPVPTGLTFNAGTGDVSVDPATPAGVYTFDYQICEKLNPTNCKTATISVTVAPAPILATVDTPPSINGASGGSTPSVISNDTLNGLPVTVGPTGNVNLTPGTAPTPTVGSITMNPDGTVTVAAGTTAGTYTYSYTICEKLNPTNCAINSTTIVVGAAPIVATADTGSGVNGLTGATNVLNAFAGDTINGLPATAANAVLTPLTPVPAGLSFNPATGNVSVAAGTPSGTYSFDYQICEKLNPTNCKTATETVTVEPVLTGTVFHDVNGNGLLDAGDKTAGAGYVVQLIDSTGALVGTDTTGAAGIYSIAAPDGTYTLIFKTPAGVEIGRTANVTMTTGAAPQNFNLPIDPSGIVYDSVTRMPVAGATLVLTDAAGTPLPAVCLLDPAQQNQVTGVDGAYRFDVVPGANAACPVGVTTYKLKITNPAGYATGFSTIMPAQAGALNDAACATAPAACQVSSSANPPASGAGVYYTAFMLGLNDANVVNNHIPIDPAVVTAAGFTKVALKSELHIGETVAYVITAQSVVGGPVQIIDQMPAGFAYVANSATVNGVSVTPTTNLNTLTFSGLVPVAGTVKLQLTLITTAAVATGPATNNAQLIDQNNGTILGKAKATVTIVPDAVFDCGDIIGKVFDDKNRNGYQDDGEPGLPGVRVATVKGQLITTDKFGRFHVDCADLPDASIGSNFVMKLDTRTLPTGYRLTTENPRDVRLTAGKVTKLNFGAAITRVVKLDLNGAVFQAGSTKLLAAWQAQLATLITTLESEPSTLRLNYYADKEGNDLAQQRLNAVQSLIAQMWKHEGDNYKLPIETRVIGVEGAPSK